MITIAPGRGVQAAYDHAKTAAEFLDQIEGEGIQSKARIGRSHNLLVDVLSLLEDELAAQSGQKGLDL